MVDAQAEFTKKDFLETESLKLRLKAAGHLLVGGATVFLFVMLIWHDSVEFYDYLTAVSIGITLMISIGFFNGVCRQADASVTECCNKAGRTISGTLTFIIVVWLLVFCAIINGNLWNQDSIEKQQLYKIIFNITAAMAVYTGYVWLDWKAYKATFKQNCGKIKAGLPKDVKRSFWQIDGPTLVAIFIFGIVTLFIFPESINANILNTFNYLIDIAAKANKDVTKDIATVTHNINQIAGEPRAAFTQGGLAFLMLSSSFAFALGFPKYVVVCGAKPWYSEKVCPQKPSCAQRTSDIGQKESK